MTHDARTEHAPVSLADTVDTAPDMNWYAWGDPAKAKELEPGLRELVSQVLRAETRDMPPVAAEDVELPASRLDGPLTARFTEVLGAEHVIVDDAARLVHAGGKSTPDLLARRAGRAPAPDAVLYPADHDEVERVLALCSAERVAVVPFGGGTSVVGGVSPLDGGFRAVVTLDLRRLNRLVSLDAASLTAVLGAGVRTPHAEAMLAEHGLTLGHVPQSYEYATIGGYAATRSSGQASAGYGRFEDMVVGLRVATPRGTLDAGGAPASAAGPDLRRLFVGSEGTLGVITEVALRVRPRPKRVLDEAWSFPDYATGVDALRTLAQSDTRPTMARLSDETETFVNAALGGREAVPGCQAVLGFEGGDAEVEARAAVVREVMEAAGGTPLGPDPVAHWRETRFHAPYLRDTLLSAGILAETLETAASWSDLLPLYTAVVGALTGALDDDESGAVVQCHVSHTYATGASLYFTVATGAGEDPATRWDRAKRAASDAIVANGGTITHHHAVGTDHRPWMEAELGPLGGEVLRAVKSALDPEGVLNPGKLIPEA
ncbi:FAD-binding oxidoreductase [Nocardiopsis sp. L17-MgMaSL7]|uniref:FAD-binding oxidoreductase n=1 Tax=Nocardiopsis sp. L17-MgMaSL7 TaxID=1938893 RepID=UPI000D97D047|nr:FAD-binding oxidoreductase [Nocardiopsis sp. L17-MgMaSL7]PWV52739.1 alkyldihydroxyacetonephosphate synthase [Nocardiopsis sp. L17-MgMaSL7]